MSLTSQRGPKEIWDRYSEWQWVYFAEEIKQRISYFLSDKLFGKNLDIGWGRYLSYPHSTVIDVSPKALAYNPAKEKVEFDLDDIHKGKQFPFPDHSFDHATMISVYQYLKGWKQLRDELMRILKPGSELYIINLNGGGSGLSSDGVLQGPTHISSIKADFDEAWFTTLVENIPFHSDITQTQSLCIAMPGIDLFGPNNWNIRNQDERIEKNKIHSRYRPFYLQIENRYGEVDDAAIDDETKHTDVFTAEYSKWELKKMNDLFYKIATYPVTEFSLNYRKFFEAFTEECLATTECMPIITSYTYNDIDIDMLEGKLVLEPSIHVLGRTNKPSDEEVKDVMEIAKKYGLTPWARSNPFKWDTIEEIVDYYTKREKEKEYSPLSECFRKKWFSKNEQYSLTSFLAQIPFNGVTKNLQNRLYTLIQSWAEREEVILAAKDAENLRKRPEELARWKQEYKEWKELSEEERWDSHEPDKPSKPEPLSRPWYCHLDQIIMKYKAKGYFGILKASKQRRHVNKLLSLKDKYLMGEWEAKGWKEIDYLAYIPYFPDIFAEEDERAFRWSKSRWDD